MDMVNDGLMNDSILRRENVVRIGALEYRAGVECGRIKFYHLHQYLNMNRPAYITITHSRRIAYCPHPLSCIFGP